MMYHLYFFQMMQRSDLNGELIHENDVAGRLEVECVKVESGYLEVFEHSTGERQTALILEITVR